MEADRLVKLGAGLHGIDHGMCAAVPCNRGIEQALRLVGDTKRGDGPDDHLVAHRLELICCVEWGLAELGHVGEERYVWEGCGELFEHFASVQCFGEDRVGSGIDIEPSAIHSGIEAFDPGGVGARDDHDVAACLFRGGDLGGHVDRGDKCLAVEVSALFGQDLVFQMDRPCARFLKRADHVHDIKCFAIAGVPVHQQRQPGRAHNLANEECHLIHGDNAKVRQAHRGGHRRAGQVKPVEPGVARLDRGLAVVRAGQPIDARTLQRGAEAFAGGFGGKVVSEKIGQWVSPQAASLRWASGTKGRFSGPV